MPQTIQFCIGVGIFFDISIRRGNIRLRLVIVIIGHKKLYGVVGEKLPELRTKLCCQRLVMSQHQRGALQLLDHVGHHKGLARAGNTQHGLLFQTQFGASHKLLDGLGLSARRGIRADEFKSRHDAASLLF